MYLVLELSYHPLHQSNQRPIWMRKLLTFLPLIATLLLGCNTDSIPLVYKVDVQQGNVVTQEMLSRLEPGMSKRKVSYVMGTPLLVDVFNTEEWIYLYSFQKGRDNRIQRRISLFFEEEQLARISGDIRAASGNTELAEKRRTGTVEVTLGENDEDGGFLRKLIDRFRWGKKKKSEEVTTTPEPPPETETTAAVEKAPAKQDTLAKIAQDAAKEKAMEIELEKEREKKADLMGEVTGKSTPGSEDPKSDAAKEPQQEEESSPSPPVESAPAPTEPGQAPMQETEAADASDGEKKEGLMGRVMRKFSFGSDSVKPEQAKAEEEPQPAEPTSDLGTPQEESDLSHVRQQPQGEEEEGPLDETFMRRIMRKFTLNSDKEKTVAEEENQLGEDPPLDPLYADPAPQPSAEATDAASEENKAGIYQRMKQKIFGKEEKEPPPEKVD